MPLIDDPTQSALHRVLRAIDEMLARLILLSTRPSAPIAAAVRSKAPNYFAAAGKYFRLIRD